MLKLVLNVSLLAALGYLITCCLLYLMQRSMLYSPTPDSGDGGAEIIWLDHQGQRLKIHHAAHTGEKALLYFGGNAEDVALNLPQFRRLFPDHALYFANYRGYGGSSGSPSEQALNDDALATYDLLAKKHGQIAVIGRSLGTGVAVALAAKRPVSRLVLVTPFDSMVNLAAQLYPFFPVRLLLLDRYDSRARASSLRQPTFILIAADDEVIPRERTDALIAALPPESTSVVVVAGTGHNTISTSPEYEAALAGFLAATP